MGREFVLGLSAPFVLHVLFESMISGTRGFRVVPPGFHPGESEPGGESGKADHRWDSCRGLCCCVQPDAGRRAISGLGMPDARFQRLENLRFTRNIRARMVSISAIRLASRRERFVKVPGNAVAGSIDSGVFTRDGFAQGLLALGKPHSGKPLCSCRRRAAT